MGKIRGRLGGFFVITAGSCVLAAGSALADVPDDRDALVIRVVHADRQAAQLIKLFEGSRAPHPAAALAAWKRATRDPTQLGKTLEAVIALANPEMVREWKIFHQAEMHMNFSKRDGTPSWHFVAPHDDGTAASLITAFRLSNLEDAPPLVEHSHEYVVTRFPRTGSAVLTRSGTTLVLAGSRDELCHAVRRLDPGGASPEPSGTESAPAGPSKREHELDRFAGRLGSGLVFDLRPPRIATPSAGSLEMRRSIELLHALGCGQIVGTLALQGERLSLDMKTQLDVGDRPSGGGARSRIDPAWLTLIPAQNLLGIVSLAVETSPRFWDRFFAVADRLERVDPVYRNVASLRTRFNLLAKGGGLRPEANLWPHLRGITAAAIGDPQKAGRIALGILVLHADADASAANLADNFVPRLGAIGKGKFALSPAPAAAKLTRQAAEAGAAAMISSAPRRLGTIGGRTLAVRRIGRDVLVGWGDEGTIELLTFSDKSRSSAGDVCAGWARDNKPAPSRLGALWPGRLAPALSVTLASSPAARILADDPPLVWWGWNEKSEAHDVVFWSDLSRRVRRFLDELPMDPPPYR